MTERIPVTAEGLKKLQEKLAELKDVRRPQVEKRLGEAREMGDVSDSAEFRTAREELWRVDRQIAEVQDQLSRAEIVSSRQIDKDTVAFSAKVTVKDVDTESIDEYILVGEGESNLAENKIAITTPIGQGLLGHKAGDIVKIKIPAGFLNYQIMKITYDL